VQITANIVTYQGKVSKYNLLDGESLKVERFQIKANFAIEEGVYPVTTITSEEELDKFIGQSRGISVFVGRFLLPRVRFGAMYWPPSERTAQIIIKAMQDFSEGKTPDPRPFKIEEIEGTDLSVIWEPFIKGYPKQFLADSANKQVE